MYNMKKLKKLKLNDFSSMSKEEQSSIFGGGWIWDPYIEQYVYELNEVTVYGYKECPACKAGREYIQKNYGSGDAAIVGYTILGFQHICGFDGHR